MYIKGMKESFYDFDKTEVERFREEATPEEKNNFRFITVFLWDIIILPVVKILKGIG
jgi:hypothetical protein